ncbi:MAG: hypothetical protein QOK22_1626 [Gaiellaceae bacterium]|nr:hypothetical protein [Gaiellaceae bacterium]
MKITLGTLISGIATVAVLAAGWFFFAPTQLGGSVSYVQIYGTSMNPSLHAGDLVLVRNAPSYKVGDVVAYHNGELGGHVVLHRIIGSKDGTYTFKGDNNDFVDSFHPTSAQLVGTMWFHVPAVGRALVWLRGTHLLVLAAVGALIALLLSLFRRRRPGTRERGNKRVAPALPTISGIAPMVAGALALAFAGLALLSFTRPLTSPTAQQGIYTQTGHFSYDAVVPGGTGVYGSTTVKTGQPLFTKLVHSVRFHFTYAFDSSTQHAVGGTVALDAVVTGSSGWKRTLVLTAPQTFTGDHATVDGVLTFAPLLALLKQVDTLTNVVGGTYTLTLVPHVAVKGVVDGSSVHEQFAPQLPLTLDPQQLQLQPGSSTGPSATTALTQTTSGSGTVMSASRISLLKLHLSVRLARSIALFGGAAALIAFLVTLLLARRSRPAGEHELIRREYGDLIVDVASLPSNSTANTVQATSFDGVSRVAEQSGHVIMHVESDGIHTYVVEDGGVFYVYSDGTIGATVTNRNFQLAQGA